MRSTERLARDPARSILRSVRGRRGRPASALASAILALAAHGCGAASAPPQPAPIEPPPPAPISIADGAAWLAELEERMRGRDVIIEGEEITNGDPATARTFEIHLAGGGARYRFTAPVDGVPNTVRMETADGAEMLFTEEPGGRQAAMPRPDDLRDLFVLGTVRLGAVSAIMYSLSPELRFLNDGPAECCWAELEDVAVGERAAVEGVEAIALHGVYGQWDHPRGRATLWIDPARGVPVRREAVLDVPGATEDRVVEVYRRFELREPAAE